MRQIDVRQLKARLDDTVPKPLLLDVRESWEVRLCALDGAIHIPMGQIPARCDELDPACDIVVICHHGVRSYQVAHFLDHQGFGNVYNLSGGINAWAHEIDQAMRKY
ncbi:MAG: rhodanese-like domain-containing protein [Acidiferrobacterales bacterium]